MKKMLLLVVLLFSLGSYAQEERTMPNKTHLIMQDEKMWIMKDGKSSPMEEDLTLNEGTTVSRFGKVVMKDGSTKDLLNGEAIDMDGVITKHTTKATTNKTKMK